MLKNVAFFITIIYTLVLSALSLLNINNVVKHITSFNDKVSHSLAHFIFVILWFVVFFYKFNFKYTKALMLASIFSIAYGLLIEALQGWATISRQSDFNDVLANTLGLVFAVVFLLSVKKHVLKIRNSLHF